MLDLDQTIVHTPGIAEQHVLEQHVSSGRVFDVSVHHSTLQRLLCAPRSHILDFFSNIRNKFHVMYCTAGDQNYGEAVVKGLQDFMLARCREGRLDIGLQQWIKLCTDSRYCSSAKLAA